MLFRSRDQALTLGTTGPALWRRPFRLTSTQARASMHVIGTSGFGKSRFLAGLFLSLHDAGLPATLIDPHGDLARLVLGHLVQRGFFRTPAAFERLLYLDLPAAQRQARFLPFNLLAGTGSPYEIAANVREAFHRAWPALADGVAPRFDKLVVNGVKVLISNGLPLPALYRFLTEQPFREQLVAAETDPDVVALWRGWYDRLPEKLRLEYADSTLSRLNLLVFDPVLKYSLAQRHSLLAYRQIVDGGRSVIANLALGSRDARRLLGCLLTVAAEQAALSRAELPPETRHASHHLIIDEFSDFTAQSEEALTTMLSQTRKFGLFLVMAHQTWSQASARLRGAMQNAGLEVVFRVGREDAEHSATIMGRVDARTIRQDAEDAESEVIGMREQWEGWAQQLHDQWQSEAYVAINNLRPYPFPVSLFRTRPPRRVVQMTPLHIPDPTVSPEELARVEEHYLATCFRAQAEIEREIAAYRRPEPAPGPRPRAHVGYGGTTAAAGRRAATTGT